MNKYKISSLWAGRYAKTKHGYTNTIGEVIWITLVWSIAEFFRVLKLNKYHYGNIFGLGKKITDKYGGKLIKSKTNK